MGTEAQFGKVGKFWRCMVLMENNTNVQHLMLLTCVLKNALNGKFCCVYFAIILKREFCNRI